MPFLFVNTFVLCFGVRVVNCIILFLVRQGRGLKPRTFCLLFWPCQLLNLTPNKHIVVENLSVRVSLFMLCFFPRRGVT